MIRCNACGTEYDDGASYCPNCFALSEKTPKELSFTEEGAAEVSAELGGVSTGTQWDSYLASQREEEARQAAEARQVLARAAEERAAAADTKNASEETLQESSPVISDPEGLLPDEEPAAVPVRGSGSKGRRGAGGILAAIVLTASAVLLLCAGIFYFLLRTDVIAFINDKDLQMPAAGNREPDTEPKSETVFCTGLRISEKEIHLRPGEKADLTASAAPENTTDTVCWSSVDHRIVLVDQQGQITAIGEGTAEVLVTCGDFGQICVVTVSDNAVTPDQEPVTDPEQETEPDVPEEEPGQVPETPAEPALNYTDITMQSPGEKVQLVLNNAGEEKVVWASSNEKVALVDDNGIVTAIGTGTVKVTAEVGENVYTCVVRCPLGGVEGETMTVALNYSDVTLTSIGESFTLRVKYVIEPENPAKVVWTSSNPDWCTVDENGKVTVMAGGWTSTVTVTAEVDGVKLRCIVRCNAPIPE